jgi:uncharacterized protein YhdP
MANDRTTVTLKVTAAVAVLSFIGGVYSVGHLVLLSQKVAGDNWETRLFYEIHVTVAGDRDGSADFRRQ